MSVDTGDAGLNRSEQSFVSGIQNSNAVSYDAFGMSVVTAEVKVDETDIVNVKNGSRADA